MKNDSFTDFTKQEKSNYEIQTRYFTPSFKDPMLEEKYFINLLGKTNYIFLALMVIFILTEIGMIIYGSFHIMSSKAVFYSIISICLAVNLILFFLYAWIIESPSKKSYIELVSITLFIASLIIYLFSFIAEGKDFNFTRIIYLLIFSKYI